MITRLKELEIRGFRSFHATGPIDLDADVILIYGKNGTGKTSIMSAVELGITGQVQELSRFTSDYPRCLRNVRWNSQVEVKLSVETPNGDGTLISNFDGQTISPSGNIVVSTPMRRFFSDRCYLSQSRLSRLLELYQAPDGDESEQLLVRFIRELLGLDLLENITGGLFEAGDVRRLENACPSLGRLKAEITSVEQSLNAINRQLPEKIDAVATLSKDAKSKIETLGDPFPDESWNLTGIKKRCEALLNSDRSQNIRTLQHQQGRINQIIGFLSRSTADSDAAARTSHGELLMKAQEQRSHLEQTLLEGLTFSPQSFPELNIVLNKVDRNSPVERRIQIIQSVCERILSEFENESKSKTENQKEFNANNKSAETLTLTLQELDQSLTAKDIEKDRLQLDLLRLALENIHGDDCPVCGQHFSVTVKGDLKEKLRAEIKRLGADIKVIEETSKRKREITESLATTLRRREIASKKVIEVEQKLAALSGPTQTARALDAFILGNQQTLKNLDSERENIAQITERLKSIEIRIEQQQGALVEGHLLADEMQISGKDRPASIMELVRFLSVEVDQRLQRLEKRRSMEEELRGQVSRFENACYELERAQEELGIRKARFDELSLKKGDIDKRVQIARRLSQAAAAAKAKLLDQVFNETLNNLWKNLYRRLARQEDFVPQLSEPTLTRGKIETHIAGTMKGVSPFDNFAAVSSLGNLNTAALSLFLALHLVESPKHQILLLDDPVQNMDDLHVIQFASLLKSVAFQAKRQLMIAVHEKALFDYLALELGPSRDGDSLCLLTISRDDGSSSSTVRTERRIWKADELRFGT